jgi:hypothetical protein
MAVKFGMTVLEIMGQLTNGFRKVMGRDPDGLEKIKIQQEAVQRFKDMNKVVDMQGETIDTSKGIIGGRQIQDNKEFGEALKKALMETDNPYSDLVKTTQKGPKTLEQRRKEAEEALKNKNVTPIKDPEDMAQGGRAGFAMGLGPRFIKFLNETNPIEAYKKYLQSVKKRAQEGDVKSLAPELGAVTATGVFINRRMKDVLENMKNQDMENTLENFKKELDADPFYKEYPEIKDKVLENYTETMFGEKKADGGRAGFANGSEDSGAPSIVLNPEERAMDKEFETSDVKEAIKEIIKRSIGPLDMAEIPISEKGRLRFGFDSSGSRQLTGGLDLLGGELNIGMGSGKQGKGMGFEFRKRFEKGGMSRRQFMKIMGGIATLPVLGKFIKPAMPLIQKGAEITGPALDKIVQTVMSAGKLISQSGRRVKEMVTKKKLKDVEVEEDIMDGPSYTIKTKDKTIYYRPGRQDEMGIDDDIIEVIEDTVTKKAGGGIARMLGE